MQDPQDGVRQELALRALLVQRCHRAYLHDMRGGLQALTSAFELLARAAKKSVLNAELLHKTTLLFARASAEHEATLSRSLDDLCVGRDQATDFDVLEPLGEVVRFLLNDAAERGVSLHLSPNQPVTIHASRKNLRFIALSLLTRGIDGCEPGAVITVHAGHLPRPSIRISGITLAQEQSAAAPLLPVVQRLLALDGGTMSADAASMVLQW